MVALRTGWRSRGAISAKRNQDETAQSQSGMGNGQLPRRQDRLPHQQNVEVDGTGRVAGSRPPAQGRFDRLEQAEQLPGRKIGLRFYGAVEEQGLRRTCRRARSRKSRIRE